MKLRRHVILFQSRFADQVERGEKTQTIRPVRKRSIRVGDILDLRAWVGLPYRSKQRKLRETVAARVARCSINSQGCVEIDGERPPKGFAKRDGFPSHCALGNWFARMHGLPFSGVLIQWYLAP